MTATYLVIGALLYGCAWYGAVIQITANNIAFTRHKPLHPRAAMFAAVVVGFFWPVFGAVFLGRLAVKGWR